MEARVPREAGTPRAGREPWQGPRPSLLRQSLRLAIGRASPLVPPRPPGGGLRRVTRLPPSPTGYELSALHGAQALRASLRRRQAGNLLAVEYLKHTRESRGAAWRRLGFRVAPQRYLMAGPAGLGSALSSPAELRPVGLIRSGRVPVARAVLIGEQPRLEAPVRRALTVLGPYDDLEVSLFCLRVSRQHGMTVLAVRGRLASRRGGSGSCLRA